MTMIPFNGDFMQALKWQQNKAPGIISLLQKKRDWYDQYNQKFWADWEHNIFDLRTANPFGLMIWCIILGVPAGGFGLYPAVFSWAYGAERQNFVYSGANPSLPDKNLTGGNFYGGGSAEILNLDEIRWTLQLRYVALVNNGSIAFINFMLRYIFNKGEPWDFVAGRYFYLVDSTFDSSSNPGRPAPGPFNLEYRIGPAMGLSSQLINLYNDPKIGIMPSSAGSKITVIQE